MEKYPIIAGRTTAFCGETIRILSVVGDDPDDQVIVGLTGRITHPFSGLMVPECSSEDYIAGVYLDPHNHPMFLGERTNLMVGDTFEVIDHSTIKYYG